MPTIRLWHTYLGIFIAPSVLFFALTGILQLFSLHEAHGPYHPPALLEQLGSVHKDQVIARKHHDDHDDDHAAAKPSPPSAGVAGKPKHDDDQPKVTVYLLKWFFTLVALGLIVSTSLGLWMGLSHVRRGRTGWILLIAGAVIPVALLLA